MLRPVITHIDLRNPGIIPNLTIMIGIGME